MANENINQSIIVSGESGSGKTQSAKLVMRYFAVVQELLDPNSNQKSSKDTNSIEDAVLSTNPIMEAFGNAKTTRNDNSSRFGKYLEILFDQKPSKKGVCITGAHIKVYLLERSRLTVQAASERNFHIFYQMCAVPDNKMFDGLGIKSCEEFFYLKQGKMGVIKGIDDREELNITIKGMSVVGIPESSQR
jgi:myosin-5